MRYLILIFPFLIGVGAGAFALAKFGHIGQLPQITLQKGTEQSSIENQTTPAVGNHPNLILNVQSPSRVCFVSTSLHQNTLQVPLVTARGKQDVAVIPLKDQKTSLRDLGFQEGPAEIAVAAQDCSLFRRKREIVQKVVLDFTPPQVQITSTQHYINQGGANVATYTTSPDAVWSGIRVGSYEFQGHSKPGSPANSPDHFAFFVFSYELPADTKIQIVATDEAGNTASTSLKPARFFPKQFRKRSLPIEDAFIDTKVMDILTHTPDFKDSRDRLKNFLTVNRDIRKSNAQFLRDLSQKSEEKLYWKDAFEPLGNAAIEANFADYRDYMYNNEKVDEQVHLGFDMAVTEHYPIQAGNSGKVLFADYLGVYGNTVILDHGYGLMTLYGHLSSIGTKVGEKVEKGQKLGNSGATGLASGDHLHFSLLIDGVQTNPVEFWDQHWIDDNVYLRLGQEAFGAQ